MSSVEDPHLEQQGRRFGRSAGRWLLLGAAVAVPGVVLVVVGLAGGPSWMWPIGVTVLVFASIPAVIGVSLVVSSVVSRWSARHKSFA